MNKNKYIYEEFQEWLKNHPVSGRFYSNHYKEYKDPKLPASPNITYKKNISEIFGNVATNDMCFYTLKEFYRWLKNYPEVISWSYYKKYHKKYNDPKLPARPDDMYKINISKIFGIIASKNKIFYTDKEFRLWLESHSEVVSGVYYSKHYKEYKDPKLPAVPNDIYKKKIFGKLEKLGFREGFG